MKNYSTTKVTLWCILLLGILWQPLNAQSIQSSSITYASLDLDNERYLALNNDYEAAIALAQANLKSTNAKKNRPEFLKSQMLLALAWEKKCRAIPQDMVSLETTARLLDECISERKKESSPLLLSYALSRAYFFHSQFIKDNKRSEFYLKSLVDLYDWHDDTQSLLRALINLRQFYFISKNALQMELAAHKLILSAGYVSNEEAASHCVAYMHDAAVLRDSSNFDKYTYVYAKLANKVSSKIATTSFLNLGKSAHVVGYFRHAEDLHFKALEYAKKSNDQAFYIKILEAVDSYIRLRFVSPQNSSQRFSMTRWRNLIKQETDEASQKMYVNSAFLVFDKDLKDKDYKSALKELEIIWTVSGNFKNVLDRLTVPRQVINRLWPVKLYLPEQEQRDALEKAKILEAIINAHKRSEEAKTLYSNLLCVLYQAGADYKAAIKYKQLQLSSKGHTKEKVINLRNDVAYLYQLNGDYKSAFDIFKSIQEGYKEAKNFAGQAEQEGKIAYLFMMQKKDSKAKSSFDKAIGLAQKTKKLGLLAHHTLRKAEYYFWANKDKTNALKAVQAVEKLQLGTNEKATIAPTIKRLKELFV